MIIKNEPNVKAMAKSIPYKQQVIAKIRQKYSLDEELAIQRQRDSKPQEFKEYFDYCELCKKEIKDRMGVNE